MQEARLLTILVEFNDNGERRLHRARWSRRPCSRAATCVPGTVQNGPLHNNIPNPTTFTHEDNNTFWVPDFSPDHFDKMLYTKTGITTGSGPT